MAVTTKKTFPATSNSTTDTFGPIGIELNNQDDLDVYVTKTTAGIAVNNGLRIKHYKQSSSSTLDANHPQVNDTTGLYFPALTHTGGTETLENYTISADNNNVIFNSALPSGAVVSVERRTRDSSSSYTSFSGGSTIRSTDLNTAFDEARFTAQEGRNKAFDLERQTFSEDGNIRLLEDQSLVYEGATDDLHETKLAITDPTADRTITFPDVSGNVVTTGDTGTVDATMLATNSVNSDELVADSVITAKIANDQVTYAKIQNVSATDRILGRDSAGAGDIEEITPAALRTMLNLEDGSTGDQSNAEIRAAVEAATDSNVFTDADHTKLNSVETGATADQSNAEIRAAVEAASDSNVFTDADHSKLNAIEPSATADQTGAEIKSAYEGESNTNAFTDAEKSKVADAVLNADLDGKGEILVGDGSGDPTAFPASTTNGHILTIDTTEATGMKWAANAGAGGGGSSLTVIDESTTLTTDATKLKFVGAGVTATEPSTDEITVTVSRTGDLVEDTTPQLGGALDVQAQEINTSTTNGNIKLTPNGTGVVEVKGNTNPGTIQLNCENNSHGVKIKGPAHSAAASYTLTLPDDDGTVDQVLKTDGSGNLSWGANVVIWTLGINGGADAFTFTGPGFASATDDPRLYLSRGQTYKFINGNSSGTHAFNIERSDHDQTWSAYTTGMTGAGATGGNTMTWTVPMDAPSLLRYVSGTTASMTGNIQITDGTNTDEGFSCWTGSRVSGLQIDNGANGSHMAFFGTHPSGYQPLIKGRAGATTTFQDSDGYDFDKGNVNLQSYGTNTTTPATIKFEGGGSNNTYGVTISGPATAQATSNYTITLPGVVPTSNGQVLSATTAGVCSWADSTPLTTEGDILYRDGSGTQRLAKGTAGQALIMNSGATAPEWGAAGATIANDANNRVITADGSAGLNGEANLTFDGSTLALTGNQTVSTTLAATGQITGRGFECPATVSDDWTIAAGNNAFFPGPMTVAANKTVTVPANRTLTIV